MSSKDLEIAVAAAKDATKVIKSFNDQHRSLNVQYKGRHDLVTKADVASEEKIISVIKDAYPDDLILAEETASDNTLSEDRVWIIDPIDGTTNFTHGFPAYCVSIALYEYREAKIGLVYEVTHGEMFTAEKGKGAFLNGEKISVSNYSKADESLLGTGFPYRDLELVDEYLDLFKVFMYETQGVRRPGSAAYDLCSVAAGRFEGFYEYGLSPWDVAAGALIIREAGGIVTDWNGGDDWLFGKRIVTGNPDIHSYVLKRLKENISEKHRSGKK
ncbi:MAG TPA: inositol monophosphatase family protein [Balneolales bacterium]|nr:inositol monophosphatase family protein [Balneolales bacterium]